jgi:hypothetical protein
MFFHLKLKAFKIFALAVLVHSISYSQQLSNVSLAHRVGYDCREVKINGKLYDRGICTRTRELKLKKVKQVFIVNSDIEKKAFYGRNEEGVKRNLLKDSLKNFNTHLKINYNEFSAFIVRIMKAKDNNEHVICEGDFFKASISKDSMEIIHQAICKELERRLNVLVISSVMSNLSLNFEWNTKQYELYISEKGNAWELFELPKESPNQDGFSFFYPKFEVFLIEKFSKRFPGVDVLQNDYYKWFLSEMKSDEFDMY